VEQAASAIAENIATTEIRRCMGNPLLIEGGGGCGENLRSSAV